MSSQRRPGSARIGAPRGPLPAGVYWRRRLFVLGVAFALVFVLARWLGGNSDGSSDEPPTAEQAGSQVQATETETATPGAGDPTATQTVAAGKKSKPKLAVPEGACEPSDIAITPSVKKGAEAGRDVTLRLSLQTLSSEACTWKLSRHSVVVRISQGGEQVWSTQQCPRAVPRQSVVVRRAVATVVKLTWAEARESRVHCTRRAEWAMPGHYTISAAPLGGEPAEAAFTLAKPASKTIKVTEKARNDKLQKKPTTPTN